MKTFVEKTLSIAKSQNGVRETGDNRGREVNQYLRAAGASPGDPWCAAFVYWCIDEAARDYDVPNPFVQTAYCPDIESWARRKGCLVSTPSPGDVFLRRGVVDGEARASHTGFVTAVRDEVFDTVEGNTNDDGSRDGIGVFLRTRRADGPYEFVRWDPLAPDVAGETYKLVLNGVERLDMPVRGGRSLCPLREWGRLMGFDIGWDANNSVPLINGKPVDFDTVVLNGSAYAAVRDLATSAGLKVDVDVPDHKVLVSR